MTERELFQAIGHVDDDLILAADAPIKKRRRPPVYWRNFAAVAACACVFLGGVAVWQNSKLSNDAVMESYSINESAAALAEDAEPVLGAAAPQDASDAGSATALGLARCVRIDGVSYYESAAIADVAIERDADGVIADSVAEDAFPEADGCSNFGTGYPYWMNEDGTVIVEIDGAYILFEVE